MTEPLSPTDLKFKLESLGSPLWMADIIEAARNNFQWYDAADHEVWAPSTIGIYVLQHELACDETDALTHLESFAEGAGARITNFHSLPSDPNRELGIKLRRQEFPARHWTMSGDLLLGMSSEWG